MTDEERTAPLAETASQPEADGPTPGSSAARAIPASLGVAAVAVIFVIAAMAVAMLPRTPSPPVRRPKPASDIVWGVTFSEKASRQFHLNWRRNFRAILYELKPKTIRLVAYWDLIEPSQGRYDFSRLDWQVAEAEKAGIPIVIAVGQKAPRWPEYHFPAWLDVRDDRTRHERLLAFVAKVVERYRDAPGLRYWQVENEPYVHFGKGPAVEPGLLAQEVELVRRSDPRHKIIVTDGGEWGGWTGAAQLGDIFGTTLYRRVYSRPRGSVVISRTPEYYVQKAMATRLAAGKPGQEYICVELQAEPWGHALNPSMTIAEQESFLTEQMLADNIAFARKTKLKTFYLWGAEWWYYLKVNGHPGYWDYAKRLMRE